MPPLFLTPPSTSAIRAFIRAGLLGMIATPVQGNRIEAAYPMWCADNGIWGGTYPGDTAYLRWLDSLSEHAERCLFAVAPDVVADHRATLKRSRSMLPRIRDLGYPVAFAAQNGFEFCAEDIWDDIDCLFIGGDTAWKLGSAAAELVSVATSIGKWVHMGRVNSERRYAYAHAIGVDSVDGTYLTYAPDRNLPNLLSWRTSAATDCPLFQV